MNNKLAITIAAGIVLLAGSATTIQASTKAAHMETTGRTLQPIGHAVFCQQFKAECSVKSTNTEAVVLNRKRWKELVDINYQVNMAVEPVTDLEYYKTEEYWTYPDKYGDCEDYVLLKQYMLMQKGWPASSLLITVVKQVSGDGHAVLTVRTDLGDFALDNLRMKIDTWDKTPYRYIKRQSVSNSGKWKSIRDKRRQIGQYLGS